jgi:hypothetical protein
MQLRSKGPYFHGEVTDLLADYAELQHMLGVESSILQHTETETVLKTMHDIEEQLKAKGHVFPTKP